MMKCRTSGFEREYRRGLLLVFFIFSLFFFAPLAVAGQQDASIIGQVIDESGAVLPGVTVTAASPALQMRELTAVTDVRGEYRLTPLPIGTYLVTYSLSGFQTVRREGVRLTGGFAAKLDVVLKIGALAETITVSGSSPVVDVTSTTSTTQLTRETLELIPTSRNGVSALLAQTPGARPALTVGGENIQNPPVFRAFGQVSESWQSVDGVVEVNPRSVVQGNYWDYASFEESTVTTMAHDADVPTRGIRINAILKSGGNDFHGTFFGAGTGRALQSTNIDEGLRAQGISGGNKTLDRWDVSGDVGGRVLRDKLWFYQSNRTRGQHDESFGGLKPDGSPAVGTIGNRFMTGKLTYQMRPSMRLVGLDVWGKKIEKDLGVTELNPWESRQSRSLSHHTSKVEWQFLKGSSFVSTLQWGGWIGGSDGHWMGHTSNVPTRDLVTLRNTGAVASAGQRTTDRTFGPKWTVSYYRPDWFFGNHEFKTGVEYLNLESDRPYGIGEGGNYQLIFRAGVPFQLVAWNYPVSPTDPIHYLHTWIQDSWTLGRRLTLNLGLRYAHDNGFIPEQCRETAPPPAQFAGAAQCFPARQFNVWNPVVPRLRAAYDVTGNGKTVIRGGWGRYAQMRHVDELQQANPNVATSTTYLWHDLNGNKVYDVGEVNLNLNGPDFVSTSVQGGGGAALANGIPNPDEKEPGTDEFTLSVERELMSNFALRVTGIRSQTYNTYRLENRLRPHSAYSIPVTNPDPGPDGRVGTADDPGSFITYYEYPVELARSEFQQPWLVNDAKANSTYSSLEIASSKRLSNRWHLMTSFSATKRHIPIVPNTAGGLTLSVATADPNAEINSSDNTWEWLGRVAGAYVLPFGMLVSGNYEHRSGDAQARTVLLSGGKTIQSITLPAEPLGSRRMPNINLLDFRVEKTVRLRAAQKLIVRVDIFNATNINTITSRTLQSGSSFLRPRGIVSARIAEFGATYTF